ncbi:MAG: hypothetical protein ACM3SY_12600 [Candidatus Omnitrophota bacterium]
MLIKKIGGNWHKIDVWGRFIVGYKSGGMVIIDKDLQREEAYIPFYHFSDFRIEGDCLYIRDRKEDVFCIHLSAWVEDKRVPEIRKVNDYSWDSEEVDGLKGFEHLTKNARAVDVGQDLLVVAYEQQGIDFYRKDTFEKIHHFDFSGYSFVDDIALDGDQLYIADVFGLRVLDITDIKNPVLDDGLTLSKGWAKDIALYRQYVLVADVLGIKIYDKNRDFGFVGKVESNKNRIAKVVVSDNLAFLSCEARGLKIVDLSNIGGPGFVSGVMLPKGVWDCAVYRNHVYLAAYTEGLIKVDFSEIKNLKQEESVADGGEIIGVWVDEQGVFAACSYDGFKIFDHDLNLKAVVEGLEDRCWTVLTHGEQLFVASGKGGIYIYEVTDLEKPVLINRVQTFEARDMVIKDDCLYVANGQRGVLVWDISDIRNIREMGNIPSSAFTRGIMVDEEYVYKADGDGGLEIYKKNMEGEEVNDNIGQGS